ncbi:MAG: tannase/feruloyl esterase family alpha/beta hydrolase, partial [Acidobacteriota bacterium]
MRKYGAMMLRLALLLIATISLHARPSCEKLTGASLPGVRILSATPVPSGPFEIPGGQGRVFAGDVPAFCRVVAVVPPEVRFELWMPDQWNAKLLAVGNGGLAGTISYGPMLKPLHRGYATSSTDTGHVATTTNDGAWALGHYQRIADFADRAVHVMAEADKVILAAYYGDAPAHSYFNGCSQGGHEALIEAQRYPGDFDGIIAGDPANNWTRHYAGGHLWAALAMEGDGYIPPSKVPLLADAVNQACDALDGVKDGVLSDPRRCRFDPARLLCPGADAPTCFTSAQVQAVNKLWAGLRDANGDQIYPGLVPGGEAGPGGWLNWITGPVPGKSAHA